MNKQDWCLMAAYNDRVQIAFVSASYFMSSENQPCLTCQKQPMYVGTNIVLQDHHKNLVNLAFNYPNTIDTRQPLESQQQNYTLALLKKLWLRNVAINNKFCKNVYCCDSTPLCKLRMLGQLSSMHTNSALFLVAYTQHVENLYSIQ